MNKRWRIRLGGIVLSETATFEMKRARTAGYIAWNFYLLTLAGSLK
jgi:hypothetical protein